MDPLALPTVTPTGPAATPRPLAPQTADEEAMRKASVEFEAVFLSEMLKYTGINKTSEEVGGGAGEDAFSGLLTQEYARVLAENGGIGLAEHIFESLKERTAQK